MAELLWAIASISGLIAGWFVANAVGGSGIIWLGCFLGTWFLVAYIVKRIAFKNAPAHVEFLY